MFSDRPFLAVLRLGQPAARQRDKSGQKLELLGVRSTGNLMLQGEIIATYAHILSGNCCYPLLFAVPNPSQVPYLVQPSTE